MRRLTENMASVVAVVEVVCLGLLTWPLLSFSSCHSLSASSSSSSSLSSWSENSSTSIEDRFLLLLNASSLHVGKASSSFSSMRSFAAVPSAPGASVAAALPSAPFPQTSPNARHDLSSLPIIMNADRVSKLLRNFANEEMAVYFMQSLFDAMQFHVDKPDPAEMVSSIAASVSRRVDAYKRTLDTSRSELISLFQKSPYDMHIFKQYRECCSLDPQYLSPSHHYNVKVNLSITCDVVPAGLSAFSFYPGSRLAKVFAANMNKNNAIRWQHFTSSEGMRFEYPAHRMDDRSYQNCQVIAERRRRQLFMSAMFNYRKQAVIIIDKGSGMSESQFSSAKCVAHVLLECFRPDDEVLVVGVSDHLLRSNVCSDVTVPLNGETMDSFHNFINLLSRDPEPVNHTLVFEIAFKILRNRPMKNAQRTMIFYISRGLLTHLTDGISVMSKIAEENLRINFAAQIHTFPVWDCCKAMMLETAFLSDIAQQNFSKFILSFNRDLQAQLKNRAFVEVHEGMMTLVNTSADSCLDFKEVIGIFSAGNSKEGSSSDHDEVSFSLTEDFSPKKSTLVSLSTLVHANGNLVGILGLDADLADLTASVIFYNSADSSSSAFLIDTDGFLIVHSKMAMLPNLRSIRARVTVFERRFPFKEFQNVTAVKSQGVLVVPALPAGATSQGSNASVDGENEIAFHFKRVPGTPFVVIISSRKKWTFERSHQVPFDAMVARYLAYHRLDLRLSKDYDICMYGKTLATFDRVGLYLAPRGFQNSFERISTSESKRTAQGFWAFVSDMTRLITNPGLKLSVRCEIGALGRVTSEWKRLSSESIYSRSILRRFLATPTGVYLVYPATMMHQHYDPTQREWFRRSMQHPSKVVLTSPNLDTSGLGYFVTMSHTLYDGKDAAMHHVNDPVVAVIGVDIPLNFWYRLLKQNVKLCREPSISCFLFDDHGFIVAYGNYITGEDLIRRSEGMHITHKEPAIASEMLQHRSFVRKVVCRRYEDQTLQRVYIFNSSYDDVIRSSDGCLHFQVAPVPLTNVFLAVVNRSCHRPTAFCPCSVTDRRCLNCYRSEPTECECPCECPYASSHCTSDFLQGLHNIQYPMCELDTFRSFHSDYDFYQWSSVDLRQCLDTNCMQYNTESACSAVIGCEWCMFKYDFSTPLQTSYCASVHTCFGGVQGLSPLGLSGDELLSEAYLASSTPIGPVAGGIMGVFVLLVVGVYWYRHLVTHIMNRLNSSSGSRLNSNDELEEEFHFDDGGLLGAPPQPPPTQLKTSHPPASQNGGGLLLASFERQNLVLPAPRARPRWRPGPRTESSDPGYSTMTGNCDDSEQTTTVDLLLPSISSSSSKKLPKPNRHSAPSTHPDGHLPSKTAAVAGTALLPVALKLKPLDSSDGGVFRNAPDSTLGVMTEFTDGEERTIVNDSMTPIVSSEQTVLDTATVNSPHSELVIQAQIHSSA